MRNTPNNARLFRSLPDLPAERVDAIKSNLSADDKQLNAKIFDFFVGRSTDYCSAIGKRIVMEEIWVRENARSRHLEAEAVCGITVEKDMVNTFGVLHGGCTAFLVDLCSSIPPVALGLVKGGDGSGMSQALNLIWHAPASLGTNLRIVSSTVTTAGGRTVVSRCELWDKASDKLLVSGVHTKVPVAVPPKSPEGPMESKL